MQLLKAIDEALKHDQRILIEKNISGRELECAVIGNGDGDTFASEIGEIIPGDEFYTYDAKYSGLGSQTVVMADIPLKTTNQIKNTFQNPLNRGF